jgi:hypothetical protein
MTEPPFKRMRPGCNPNKRPFAAITPDPIDQIDPLICANAVPTDRIHPDGLFWINTDPITTFWTKGTGKIASSIQMNQISEPATRWMKSPMQLSESDIDLVAYQANVSKDQARTALLAANGDIVDTIISLMT